MVLCVPNVLNTTAAGDVAASELDVDYNALSHPPANMAPNSQWQIFSKLGPITKMNSQGTATLTACSVTSFTTGANTVVFATANTQQMKAGDVFYSTTGDAALTVAPVRVSSVVSNVSFTGNLSYQGTAGASSAFSAIPLTCGDLGTGNGDGPDGWSKTGTLILWRDDFTINQAPGSPYSIGLRKGITGQEYFYFTVSNRDLKRIAGRTVVFGMWVYQKVQGGAGTWYLEISNPNTSSANGTGVSLGAFQWIEMSVTVPSNAAFGSLSFALSTNGNSGDVYYVSQPMVSFGNYLGTGNYTQNPNEYLDFGNHVNAPSLAPFSGNFPTTPYTVSATCTGGTIAGTVLTVSGSPTGTWAVGQFVAGASVTLGTQIASLGTGTGGAGTYNLNVASAIGGGEAMVGGFNYGGYELDLEAITYTQIARTTKSVNGKCELTMATVGSAATLFTLDNMVGPTAIFGPQTTVAAANVLATNGGMWPLDDGSKVGLGFFGLSFGSNFTASVTNLTVDFSGALLS